MAFTNIYIVVFNSCFQFWSHLPCPQDNFEPFFPAFLLYRGSVFTLLCAHNWDLKQRKLVLLACGTAKKRTVSTRHGLEVTSQIQKVESNLTAVSKE